MAKYNDKKYSHGIELVAEQVVKMVVEDGGDDCELEEMLGVALQDITERANELFSEQTGT